MKTIKRIILAIVILGVLAIVGKFLPETDDSEDRTYCNAVYDVAYSMSQKDGLRAKVYYCYLFSEADKRVIKCIHQTAGAGKTKIYEGTYEGSLEKTAVLNFDTECENVKFENNSMSVGGKTLSSESVKSAIIDIQRWD